MNQLLFRGPVGRSVPFAIALLHASVFVLACASPDSANEIESQSAAILGGRIAPAGAPFNAVARVETSSLIAGSAVLVTPSWVLTNAHVVIQGSPTQIDVFFGDRKYTYAKPGAGSPASPGIKIDQAIVATRSGCDFTALEQSDICAPADLALLHLSQPVVGIQPLHPAGVGSVPACPQMLTQGTAQSIGFGMLVLGGDRQLSAYAATPGWVRSTWGDDQVWRTVAYSRQGPLSGDSGGAVALVDATPRLCGLLEGGANSPYAGRAVVLDTGFPRQWLEAALWDPTSQRFAGERCSLTAGSDADGDRVPDSCDNCRDVSNWGQEDRDDDGVGDVCDNCIDVPNRDQVNSNFERETTLRGPLRPGASAGNATYLTKNFPGDACDQPLSVLHPDPVQQLDEVVGGETNPRRVARKFARGAVDSCLPTSAATNAAVWVNNRVVVESVRGALGVGGPSLATEYHDSHPLDGRTMLTQCASNAPSLAQAELPAGQQGSNCTRSPSDLRLIPRVFGRSTSHRYMRVGTAGAGSALIQAENAGEIKTTHDFRWQANAATVNDLRWAYWKDLPTLSAPRLGDAMVWRGVQLAWVRAFAPGKVLIGVTDLNFWVNCPSTGIDATGNLLCGGVKADAQAALRQTASLVTMTESAPAVDYSRCRPRQFFPAPDLIARDCPQCSIKPVAFLDTVTSPGIVFSNLGVSPAPPVVNPSAVGPLLSLTPATGLLPTVAYRAPAGALLSSSGEVKRVAYVDESTGAVRYDASPASVSALVSGVPQGSVSTMDDATGRLVMPIGAAQSGRPGVTQLDLQSGARAFRPLTSGTLTTPEAAAYAPGTRALFVVDRTSPGERRLVRVGEALEATRIASLPASGAITLAPEVGGRLAMGWSNAGSYGAALIDVRGEVPRVLAVATGSGQLDVAPRASEKGLEFVASTSASAEKRRVIAPLAATPSPLVNLDSLLRNGR